MTTLNLNTETQEKIKKICTKFKSKNQKYHLLADSSIIGIADYCGSFLIIFDNDNKFANNDSCYTLYFDKKDILSTIKALEYKEILGVKKTIHTFQKHFELQGLFSLTFETFQEKLKNLFRNKSYNLDYENKTFEFCSLLGRNALFVKTDLLYKYIKLTNQKTYQVEIYHNKNIGHGVLRLYDLKSNNELILYCNPNKK